MEEQFVLRVPPSMAERLNRLLSEEGATSQSDGGEIDLSFQEDGRSGWLQVGDQRLPARLLDLPCIVESWKTYDHNSLVKTADIGQMILVREEDEPEPEGPEYKHGLTPPMRDVRKRRFRREADLNPEIVEAVERDLQSIMAGGNARDVDVEVVEQEEEAEEEGGKEGEGGDMEGEKEQKKGSSSKSTKSAVKRKKPSKKPPPKAVNDDEMDD